MTQVFKKYTKYIGKDPIFISFM